MKKQFYLVSLFLIFGFTFLTVSCSKDDKSISEQLIGSWEIDNNQTNYRKGLLADIVKIDSTTIKTVLSTTASLFNNSTMDYNPDMSGSIRKNMIGGSQTGSLLEDILGGITEKLVKVNYTYIVSGGKLKIKMNGITDKEYELNIISISGSELKVSMVVTDLTDWTGAILGETVANLTESDLFKKIDDLAGNFLGISANPTIVMTYYKK